MNILRIQITNPDELLNAEGFGAGAVVHVQSGTSASGPFTDITNALTPIVSGIYEYTVYDQAGGVTTWYQSRYESANAGVTSVWSPAFQAAGSSGYCTLGDVRTRLGFSPTQTMYDEYLQSAINWVSDRIDQTVGYQFYLNPADGTSADFTFDAWDATGGDGGPGGGVIVEGGRCLLVPRGIVSMTGLEVATYTGGPFAVIPTTDWYLRPTTQERAPGYPATELWITNIPSPTDTTPSFFPGFGTVKLQGAVLGWPAVPPSVSDICQTVVISSYHARAAGGGDSYTTGQDGSRTFERMWAATDLRALGRYRLKIPYLV